MATDAKIYEEISKDDTYLITNDPIHPDMGHLLFFKQFKRRKSLEELAHEIYTCVYRISALCAGARKGIQFFDLPRAEALSQACILKIRRLQQQGRFCQPDSWCTVSHKISNHKDDIFTRDERSLPYYNGCQFPCRKPPECNNCERQKSNSQTCREPCRDEPKCDDCRWFDPEPEPEFGTGSCFDYYG